jgi:hypothetical protein
MRRVTYAAWSFLIAVMPLSSAAGGQNPSQPIDSGKLPWVVIKYLLSEGLDSEGKVIADFATDDEASRYAEKQNAALTGSDTFKWHFSAKKRPSSANLGTLEQPASPRSGALIPFVDPGKMPTGESRLGGKTLPGRIGKANVAFTFGKDGSLKIDGEMVGEGKWMNDGTALYMETARATFRGGIKGDKASGYRFTKGGGDGLVEWEIRLSDTASTTQPAASTRAASRPKPYKVYFILPGGIEETFGSFATKRDADSAAKQSVEYTEDHYRYRVDYEP